MLRALILLVTLGARALRAVCRRRADLVIEDLALRQQVTALKKERPRPPLEDVDRAFWVALRESWPAWASRLVIVKAATVAEWNRARFRRYWTRVSSTRYPGRPRLAAEIRRLIPQMAQDGWGAPRIHGELTKLGFIVSEVTVSRHMPRRPAEPNQVKRGVAFLRNHKGRHRRDGFVHGADRKSRCASESGRAAPSLRMARGCVAPFPWLTSRGPKP